MAIVGFLNIIVGSDTRGAERGLKKTEGLVAKVNKAWLAGAGAIAAATAALDQFIKAAAELDKIEKTMDRLGVAAEDLQRVQLAADLAGMSNVDLALQRLIRRSAEAAQGTGEAVNAFKELGINARAFSQLPLNQQLLLLQERFSKVANQADRVRLMMKLADSEGVALLNVIEDYGQLVDRYGDESFFSQEQLEAVARMKNDWTELTFSINQARRAVVVYAAQLDLLGERSGLSGIRDRFLGPPGTIDDQKALEDMIGGAIPADILARAEEQAIRAQRLGPNLQGIWTKAMDALRLGADQATESVAHLVSVMLRLSQGRIGRLTANLNPTAALAGSQEAFASLYGRNIDSQIKIQQDILGENRRSNGLLGEILDRMDEGPGSGPANLL